MGWISCIDYLTSSVTPPLGGFSSMTRETVEGVVITSSIRVPLVVGGGTSTCKKKKVIEHHKMHKYTALEKRGSKQKKARIEKGHTT